MNQKEYNSYIVGLLRDFANEFAPEEANLTDDEFDGLLSEYATRLLAANGCTDSVRIISRRTEHGAMFVTRHHDGSAELFIPSSSLDDLTKDLNAMAEMYADETRDSWWDADDIARSVAETIHELLS